VGTDGTLRVAGKCAQSLAADTAIAVTGCDGRASTKWRAGANSSLVSVNIGQCLTDPRNGGNNGEAVRLAACTGNANQHFTLP
jgi:ricin-type beta-trefoil lectin protein